MNAGLAVARPLKRIALIGNFPPRLCGIATFTADVHTALRAAFPDTAVDVYAMNDPGAAHNYGRDVVCVISSDDVADYQAAARRINESHADVVLVQHEYGIFGGAAGNLLLRVLDRVDAPVVLTLHTVLTDPNPDQRAVIEALVRRAARLIVMAGKGRDILVETHGVPPERIVVIPHGVPDRPLVDVEQRKPAFGWEAHSVLLTFGLLSPNKGIETMIRAMPAIVAQHPDALYVVLGATHPHLVAREGEAYRASLEALARELGVSDHVRLIDGFVEQGALLDTIEAADVYVTPYLNAAQITSGTLSYAVGLGKPVVSTPYWHAVELLADGVGILVDFADSSGFARAINALLNDRGRRDAMRRRAWAMGRDMTWDRLAHAYMAVLREAVERKPVRLRAPRAAIEPIVPRLGAIERLTDGCGILQHAIFSIPDRDHGYCVDDNCRALMLMTRIDGALSDRADALAPIYASFVQHAWNGERGRFRNFMGYDRQWLEQEGSEDSFGRSLWCLGVTAACARRADMRRWALHLFDQVASHAGSLGSARTWAFCLLGADMVLDAHPGHALAHRLVADFGARLHAQLCSARKPGWGWFEAALAYDNARLPEALIRAGARLRKRAMVVEGLASLRWLESVQTNDQSQFRAVGTDSFWREFSMPLPFDQQPLEAWASIDAAETAWAVTGDSHWLRSAQRAFRWYLGENDLGVPIGQPEDGGCFDGLMSDRVNLNQGAESVLAFQFACCTMQRLATAGTAGRTVAAS